MAWESIRDPSEIFDFWSISKKKWVNELGVVESLLENQGIEAAKLVAAEPDDPPDCLLEINSRKIGVEVVSLIDKKARKLNVQARRNGSTEFYADWAKENFQPALSKLVADKDKKILKSKADGKAASACEEFWLVINTDEWVLVSSTVQGYLCDLKLNSDVFERIFLILSYEPGREDNGYPVFALK